MAMRGFDQPGCQESRGRCVRETPRDQRAWLVHTAEAVEHHRLHGIARGHDPRVWLVSGGPIHDLTHAECIEPTRDQAYMVEELTPIGGWHGLLLSRGDAPNP